MKTPLLVTLAALAFACGSAPAQVTTLYWDPGMTGPTTSPNGGAGTWNFTSTQWFDGVNDVVWTNNGTCRAVFEGTNGGQVQIASGLIIEAERLVINKPGYFFTGGGVRRMTVHSGIIEANYDVAINMIITNPPSAASLVGLIKTGAGKLHFGVNNNTFLGGLFILEGTVVVTNKQQVGGADTPVTVNGGTLEMGASDGVSGRVLYVGDNGATFSVPNAADTWTWQQLRSTNGSITKLGAGTLNFGNVNGGGPTNVSAGVGPVFVEEGILRAQTSYGPALGTGPVTVNTNGTLSGAGVIAGAVTVKGALSPFPGGATTNALPHLTLANGLAMNEGGTYQWKLLAFTDDATGVAGKDFDRVALTNGNLTLGGASKLAINFGGTATAPDSGDPFWQANHTWTVIQLSDTAANPASSDFASLENATFAAGTFSTSVSGNGSIVLTFTSNVAPPPAPHIEAITNQGRTNVVLTWTSVSGRSYDVEYNTNLNTTNWTPLTNITAADALTTIADPEGAAAQRFYRVVLLP
jgi:autotransporter-associated beta strand protein